jgi:threonine/homoserine/homoserine lactone efflux protein
MDLFSISLLSLMGAMSPGPDFAIVTRFAVTGCRKSALFASSGIGIAVLIHLTYCCFGISLLQENTAIFKGIQILGSGYLFYLGIKLLLTSSKKSSQDDLKKNAFRSGFFTNMLNPKACLFFLSVFSQIPAKNLSSSFMFFATMIIVTITLLWFCFLSVLITYNAFIPYFTKFQGVLTKVMGAVLITLSISSLIF